MSGLPTLTIKGGPTTQNMTVELDGVPVPGLVRLTLDLAHDAFPRVAIVLAVDKVDIDAETLVMLEALVEERDPAERS